MLTDEELATLVKDIESDRVERKSSLSDRAKIRQAICAFANDLPGNRRSGVIIVGMTDDGNCAGIVVDDQLLRTLSDMRSDGNILPFPTMTVQKRQIGDCDVAVIEVEPSRSPPVRYDGRVWIRVGPRRATATRDEERVLAERSQASSLTFDRRPLPQAKLDDLDLDLFQQVYLPGAVAPEILAENDRPILHQLMSLHLVDSSAVPNGAAVIALGKEPEAIIPGAFVQFLRVDGADLSHPILTQQAIAGPIPRLLARIDEVLETNITHETTITADSAEIQRPDYPLVALQQLARNAVQHRNYETSNAPVRIYWYADRVEIDSPGGAYGQVTRENFGQEGITDYRNPLLSEAMRLMGFVQRFGVGIALARRELARNGNPPLEVDCQPTHVKVKLLRGE